MCLSALQFYLLNKDDNVHHPSITANLGYLFLGNTIKQEGFWLFLMHFVHIKEMQLQSHIQSNERCLSVRKAVTLVIFHYLSDICIVLQSACSGESKSVGELWPGDCHTANSFHFYREHNRLISSTYINWIPLTVMYTMNLHLKDLQPTKEMS